MKPVQPQTKRNIYRILEVLKEAGDTGIHIRGIARALNLHPERVSTIIKTYMSYFVEIRTINQFGLRAKIIKLPEKNKNLTIDKILSLYSIKRSIKEKS